MTRRLPIELEQLGGEVDASTFAAWNQMFGIGGSICASGSPANGVRQPHPTSGSTCNCNMRCSATSKHHFGKGDIFVNCFTYRPLPYRPISSLQDAYHRRPQNVPPHGPHDATGPRKSGMMERLPESELTMMILQKEDQAGMCRTSTPQTT